MVVAFGHWSVGGRDLAWVLRVGNSLAASGRWNWEYYKLFIRASLRRWTTNASPRRDKLAARMIRRVTKGRQITYDWIGSRGGEICPINEEK
jgi:hypothetical protein